MAQELIVQTGRVTDIHDGDTITVNLDSGGEARVRIIGIQAMEIHPFDNSMQNDHYADEATDRLTELLGGIGSNVSLKVLDTDTQILDRDARHVFVEVDGEEVNVSSVLIEEGYVFAFPHETESTYNDTYMELAKEAKDQKIGIWANSDDFDIAVNYDAEGDDEENLSGEWIKVTNSSGQSVDISEWILRDSALNSFEFPDGTVLANGATITIYGGSGSNTSSSFYWGNTESFLDNFGDGIYLHEINSDGSYGEIKGASIFPCPGECTDPLEGKVVISANYDAEGDDNQNLNGEWVKVTNISSSTIDLQGYQIHSDPDGSDHYYFEDQTLLRSGEELTLYIGSGTDTALEKYWNKDTGILANEEDRVWIDTLDGIMIDEFAWPATNCTDYLQGKVTITANYDAPGDDNENLNGEWIKVTNTSSSTVNLKGYQLHSEPLGSDHYYFEESTPLHAGEELTLYIGSGTESRLERYWDKETGILANGGDRVWLDTLDNILITEYSWPDNDPTQEITVPDDQVTQVLELYTAYFNRAADKAGVDYWLGEMNNNDWDINKVANTFAEQTEYTNLYEGLSHSGVVAKVYTNVLNRTADEAGADYWSGELSSGNISVTQLIQAVITAATEMDSDGNYVNIYDAGLFNNKIEVSQYYYDKNSSETNISLDEVTQECSSTLSLKTQADALFIG